jgi:hypothetical protein
VERFKDEEEEEEEEEEEHIQEHSTKAACQKKEAAKQAVLELLRRVLRMPDKPTVEVELDENVLACRERIQCRLIDEWKKMMSNSVQCVTEALNLHLIEEKAVVKDNSVNSRVQSVFDKSIQAFTIELTEIVKQVEKVPTFETDSLTDQEAPLCT